MPNKSKIWLILLIIAANMIFAGFANAQSVAPDELSSMNKAAEAAKGKDPKSPEVQAIKTTIINACKGLGERIMAITENKFTTALQTNDRDYFECVFGLYQGTSTQPDYMGRMIKDPYRSADAADKIAQAIKNQTAPVTKQTYDQNIRDQIAPPAADSEAGTFAKIVGWIAKMLFALLTSALLALAAVAGQILTYFIDSSVGATMPESVSAAWTMVRDVMNLVFIIALIVIAIGTILRIESYSYKKLLVRLVLMALLINFSKVIADTLIGFADNLTKVIAQGANFTSYGLLFKSVVGQGQNLTDFFTTSGGWKEAGYGLVSIVFAVILTVSMCAIALLLLVRTIGLWVLVVVSPAAYALNVLPSTQKYAKQWWSKFIQYLIWAPISIFFLRLGLALIDANRKQGPDYFLILISTGFMWAGFYMAKSSGMIGAAAITGAADKALSKAKQAGKWTAGAAGSMAARGTLLKGAGALAGGDRTAVGRGLKSAGNWVGTKSAQIKTLPGAVKQKAFDNPNAARKREVDKQAARWQLGLAGGRVGQALTGSFSGEVTKDNAALLKPQLLWEMMQKGDKRINATLVEGVKEFGNRNQLNALANGIKQGLLDDKGENGRDTAMAIRKAHYMATGGKEKDWNAYVEPSINDPLKKDDIEVRNNPTKPAEGKDKEKDYEKKVVINYKQDVRGNQGGGGEQSQSTIVITDANRPAPELSNEERRARKYAAAGMTRPEEGNRPNNPPQA